MFTRELHMAIYMKVHLHRKKERRHKSSGSQTVSSSNLDWNWNSIMAYSQPKFGFMQPPFVPSPPPPTHGFGLSASSPT